MTRSKFHTEDPKILDATVQNLDATATWHPDLCTPGVLFSNRSQYSEAQRLKFGPHTSYPDGDVLLIPPRQVLRRYLYKAMITALLI